MRFFMLVFGLTATCCLIYFVILFWGLGRTVQKFEHPFSKLPTPQAAVPWDSPIWAGLSAGQKERVIVWIDVYRAKDDSLRALPSNLRPQPQDPSPRNLDTVGPTLKSLVETHLERPLILNVVSNVDSIDLQLDRELKDFKLPRVLVQSESDNVMQSIKKLQPLWIYGTSSSDRVRWNMFSSLALTPAVTFTGDIFVAPLRVRNFAGINAAILTEINRRGLLLLVGPLANNDEVRQAQGFNPDIYFVTEPEAFAALPTF
jgi:hypothetical protein